MNDCKRLRDKVHGTDEIVPVWCQDVYEAPEEIRDVLYKEELDEIAMLQDSIGISPYDALINGVNQIPYEREGPMEESTTAAKINDIIDEHTNEHADEKTNEKADKKADEKADEKVDEKADQKADQKAKKKAIAKINEVNGSNIEVPNLTKARKYGKNWHNDLSIFSVELLSKNYFIEKNVGKHYSLPINPMTINHTLWEMVKGLFRKVKPNQKKDAKILAVLRICLDIPWKIYSHYLSYFRKKDQSPRYFYETYSIVYAIGFVELFEAVIGPCDTIKLFCEFLYLSQKQKQGSMITKVQSLIQSVNIDGVKSNEILSLISKIKPLKYNNNKCGLFRLFKEIPCLSIILSRILQDPDLTDNLTPAELFELSELCSSIPPAHSPSPQPNNFTE
ncbi:unnamed protein product [Moneuplotes crassus]|uniref:Uncharacterized protein n=1 Tax=Euplotes crassus TaxID=5936 RepID=A0AAD1XG36_EUPCR|nr:unnamed protein product [Moneuplotes crassus]